MIDPFPVIEKSGAAVPIRTVSGGRYAAWIKKQPAAARQWLEVNRFRGKPGSFCLLPAKNGGLESVICGMEESPDIWSLAHLTAVLPQGAYRLEERFPPALATQMALGWALAAYRFTHYKKSETIMATLVAPQGCDMEYVRAMAEAVGWARDLINIPANDMTPKALAEEAVSFAEARGGKFRVIAGEALLKENYPLVYAVGKAAAVPPRLVDIRFPKKGAPRVVLVGKGITFDSGGLDIKSSSNMRLMKKDMAGVAIMLALAQTIVDTALPVDLRLVLPMAENAVSGNANRPLDIIRSRKGLTVEIGNTDAEGRLVLCDALAEADEGKPDLLIDCSTLTGAARVALGLNVPAFFTPSDKLASAFMEASEAERDPVWRLPLWKDYRKHMDSPNADISNDSDSAYGGAITAALYLQEFVTHTREWLHLDMMAWNMKDRPGRPQGGEAMAVRALYALIKEKYDR